MKACEHEKLEVVKLLVTAKVDINARNKVRHPYLHAWNSYHRDHNSLLSHCVIIKRKNCTLPCRQHEDCNVPHQRRS
jgi:hypothetical protein